MLYSSQLKKNEEQLKRQAGAFATHAHNKEAVENSKKEHENQQKCCMEVLGRNEKLLAVLKQNQEQLKQQQILNNRHLEQQNAERNQHAEQIKLLQQTFADRDHISKTKVEQSRFLYIERKIDSCAY